MSVFLRDVRRELKQGGHVEFTWGTCSAILVALNGERLQIDGRSYQAFLNALGRSLWLHRCESGSTETQDLVIKWWDSKRIMEDWRKSVTGIE